MDDRERSLIIAGAGAFGCSLLVVGIIASICFCRDSAKKADAWVVKPNTELSSVPSTGHAGRYHGQEIAYIPHSRVSLASQGSAAPQLNSVGYNHSSELLLRSASQPSNHETGISSHTAQERLKGDRSGSIVAAVHRKRGSVCTDATFSQMMNERSYIETVRSISDRLPTAVPRTSACAAEKKAFLLDQLDRMAGKVILDHLVVLGGLFNRFAGGQSVVQVVEDQLTHERYAAKFFLGEIAHKQELMLYTDTSNPLGQFLPQMLKCADPGDIVGVNGSPMPACIVMEKGEAMDVWIAQSGDLDTFGGLQALHNIAERLSELHRAGYVHGDIKPGNTMWLPRKKRWTLIDFGTAAPIGSTVTNTFTIPYAAPEVLYAKAHHGDLIKVSVASDAWSLGVLAVELLVGKTAFSPYKRSSRSQMYKMILGAVQAPWEDPALLKDLGHFKKAVLGLLERDPLKRLTVDGFVAACERGRVLAQHSTTGTVATDSAPVVVTQQTGGLTGRTEWNTANGSMAGSDFVVRPSLEGQDNGIPSYEGEEEGQEDERPLYEVQDHGTP